MCIMIMARTKKQTLENASERKRQIQEEILKETVAKKKKEDFTTQGTGYLSSPNLKAMNKMKMSTTDCAVKEDLNFNGSYSTNNSPVKCGEDLPKAVIFISDICRNQIKPCAGQEEVCSSASKAIVALEQGLKKDASTSCRATDKTHSPEILKGSPKSPRSSGGKRNSHNASLETLKAVSEKVREEKSRKAKTFVGLFNGDSHCDWPKLPAHSPSSSVDFVQLDASETAQHDDLLLSDDKPKVNIFTENLGVDLGKRIRSPRRLSEDMIALPIFSPRKWSNSPKENSLAGKTYEDYSVHNDIFQSNSSQLNESFKSPSLVSVASNRKHVPLCAKLSPPNAPISVLLDSTSSSASVKNNNNCIMSSTKGESCCDPVDTYSEKCAAEEDQSDEKNSVQNKSKANEQNKEVARSRASLLCAMLIGGTEVADNYTQDRGKFKSHAPDGLDVDGISSSEQTNQSKAICTDRLSVEKKHLEKTDHSNKDEKHLGESKIHFKERKIMISKDCNSLTACEKQMSEYDDPDSECKTSGIINKKIDFSTKLKLLNEDVLKLLEMDDKDEFLESNISSAGAEEEESTAQNENVLSNDSENELYHLINILGNRLSDANSALPFSAPIDKELVNKMLQSCSKTPLVMTKQDTMFRKEQLLKRWKEKCEKEKPVSSEEKIVKNKDEETSEEINAASGSSNIDPVSHVPSSSNITARLRLSDSLSELDLDAITPAATSAVQNDQAKNETCLAVSLNQNSPHVKQGIDKERPTVKSEDLKPAVLKFDIPDEVCGKESVSVYYPAHSPKKSNSSPQISSKLSSSISTPNLSCNKENQVKSKLGNKIPVPGSSYTSRSYKKTWRLPRTILEPKPLSILSELEESSPEPKNIFTCPNLQKYLSVPSNRMIVPTEKRQEMEAVDAKAKEEQERKQIKKEEKEASKSESKSDTMLACSDPDFDEVNGVLFISFSNETELNAHLNVEKVLDWDKDDTMIRICRARAFEEAKTNKQDMGQYKLKHLRGQHMRWKKYRKFFNDEVCRLLGMKDNNSFELTDSLKKTSDITKIKGWRKKLGSSEYCDRKKNVSEEHSPQQFNGMPSLEDSFQYERDQLLLQKKSHIKLFRQLHYLREDRMIHRKLGGWSVKGNRPKDFIGSDRKRQVKPYCEVSVKGDNVDMTDSSFDNSFQKDMDKELIAKCNNKRDQSSHLLDSKESLQIGDSFRKMKSLQLICPMLTERMAINALTALQLNDGYYRKKHKKNKQEIPAEPMTVTKSLAASNQTPTLKYTTSRDLSSPSSPLSCLSQASTVNSTSMSASTTPLVVDYKEEPVSEGVEITAGSVSSPSSSVKSCSKPGCRYGCICHLCSVGDVPVASPKSKPVSMYCEKEYCRLGCICDTFDSEKPLSFRHSSMPQSRHFDMCGQDDCDNIPYLPSLKKRPKPENRFSNLPQRQRTHRASKNLDAITRKALMLYETSEIYCEKVERIRKKPEISCSPSAMPIGGVLHSHSSPTEEFFFSPSKNEFEICTEYAEEDDSFISFPDSKTLETSESTADFGTSDMQQKNIPHLLKSSLDTEDRKSFPIVEQSAHKRKRKSHPLSGEIFPSSTCARVQAFKCPLTVRKSLDHQSSGHSSSTVETLHHSKDVTEVVDVGFKPIKSDNDCREVDVTGSKTIKSEPDYSMPENNQTAGLHKVAVENNLITKTGSSLAVSKSEDFPTPADNSVPVSYATINSKNQVLSQVASISSGSFFASARQHHGWHTSMVCLKARAPPRPNNIPEDDVQEEDEVKLLEFAANCNWEGAKKEILGRVAQCLTRGQYPHPRTMNVCEFVVEILPKAQQPSLIPFELRSKLPDQMFSIRVRITRREQLKKEAIDVDQPVIDLSESSPVKKNEEVFLRVPLSKGNYIQSNQKQSVMSPSSIEIPSSSSMGISGLSKLCIANQSISKQLNSNLIHRPEMSFNSTAPVETGLEAPIPRRKSLLNKPTVIGKQDQSVTTSGTQTFSLVTPKDLFTKLSTDANPRIVDTTSSTLVSSMKGMKCSVSKPASRLVLATFDAKNAQVPKKERIVEVIVEPPLGKKLIALPLSLTKEKVKKGNQGAIINLPVCGSKQSNVLPVKLQSNVNNVSSNQDKAHLTVNGADSNKGVESTSLGKCKDNKDQMIMVFDAAHIKPSPVKKIVKPICQDMITKQTSEESTMEKNKITAQVSFPQFKPIVETKGQEKNVEQIVVVKGLSGCEKPVVKGLSGCEKPVMSCTSSLKNISQEPFHHNYASSASAGNIDVKCISESPQTSNKRNSTQHSMDDAEIPATKKWCMSGDNPIMVNDDSRGSANSCSDIHTAASPASLVDRPKSVMSTSISTASTDDILIMLSSDEDIDVCDYDSDNVKKDRRDGVSRIKSTGNMHFESGSSQRKDLDMYSSLVNYPRSRKKAAGERYKRRSLNKDTDKLEHHNQLERMRRSRLRALFEDLQEKVLHECGLPPDHVMSKANVLIEAKRVIFKLCKEARRGDAECKRYEKKNQDLRKVLSALKRASRSNAPTGQASLPLPDPSLHDGREDWDKSELVDLVSLSSEEEKFPEEAAQASEDVSEVCSSEETSI